MNSRIFSVLLFLFERGCLNVFLVALFFIFSSPCVADLLRVKTVQPISANKPLLQYEECKRYFTYKGIKQEVDSAEGRDGEGLRAALSSESLRILDQSPQQKGISPLVYFSTAGILIALIGGVSGEWVHSQTGALSLAGGVSLFGATLSAGSFFLLMGRRNYQDSLLKQATDYHNQQLGNSPIELHFTAPFELH